MTNTKDEKKREEELRNRFLLSFEGFAHYITRRNRN